MSKKTEPEETEPITVAVYVDSQHLWFAARAFAEGQGHSGGKLDYEALLGVILESVRRRNPGRRVRFVHQRMYVATRSRALGFLKALEQFGYLCREYIYRSIDDKFDWDTYIVVDMFRDNAKVRADVNVLVSGDGDFVPLEEEWPDLLVFGFPNSTSPKFSHITYLDERVIYHA